MRGHFQTPTNNLQGSIEFYEKLNFKLLSTKPEVLVTDGRLIMEINPSRYARASVKLFQNDWSEVLDQIGRNTALIEVEKGHLVASPCGVHVFLLGGASPITEKMKSQLGDSSFGLTGNFAGLSLETTDMKRSATFWNTLGFEKTMGDVDQGWVTLQDSNGMGISLMKPMSCPHLFFNPSMTFFNGKNNLNIIAQIREKNIPIVEEITHFNKEGIVDNIILRDPGGFGMFLFSD